MAKRLFDIFFSFFGLLVLAPIFLIFIVAVWLQDFGNPLYIALRVGKNEKTFWMVKIRSMLINADKSGVDSTANDDNRITLIGKLIRKFKIDELTQLWNVLIGDMSFVGPRPNVKKETDLYTAKEKKLLNMKPGITDFSSIVFSDEGDILEGVNDPDITYNQLIRPGKSKLGIFYITHNNIITDIKIIFFTLVSIFSRHKALNYVSNEIKRLGGSNDLIELSLREKPLVPMPPPGAINIVTNREGRVL